MKSDKFIPQMEPSIDDKEANAVQEYLSSSPWLTEFKKTEEFENMLCKYTGSKYCVVVTNGTISLTLALLACGVGVGDEVIVPNLTMIATPNSAKLIGAEPVFVDVNKENLCMNLDEAEKAITEKTKALIYVSLNGRTENPLVVKEFCDKHNIAFIEDAAQSLGSFYDGKHIGTFSDIGSISFSAPKIITTGQGGALLTNNVKLYDKLKKLKDFGRDSGGNDIHDTIGYNFKFTDLQAVIGIEQMKKLESRVKRKKEMYKLYYQNLKDVEGIEFISTDLNIVAPWFIDIYTNDPDKLIAYLKDQNIGSRKIYPPINKQKAYKISETFLVTEEYTSKGLWLPSSVRLTDEEINNICNTIKEFFGR